PVEDDGRAIVQRMSDRGRRVDPLQAEIAEGERTEEGRRHAQWVDGRADIVDEAGERQLGRAGTAADGVFRLEDRDATAGAGERDGGGETVGAGSHDDARAAGAPGCIWW